MSGLALLVPSLPCVPEWAGDVGRWPSHERSMRVLSQASREGPVRALVALGRWRMALRPLPALRGRGGVAGAETGTRGGCVPAPERFLVGRMARVAGTVLPALGESRNPPPQTISRAVPGRRVVRL